MGVATMYKMPDMIENYTVNKYKYVIIGAGVAGTTAAFELRKHTRDPILLIGDESGPLYNRILLPHFLKGTTPKEKLFVKQPGAYEEEGIDFVDDQTVWEIDAARRIVKTSAWEYEYEKLLLSTGSTPNGIEVPGVEPSDIFNLQTLHDAEAINAVLDQVKNPAVIGGSFIGIEFIGILAKHGKSGQLITKAPRLFENIFDDVADKIVTDHIQSLGFNVIKNNTGLISSAAADFIGLGVGVRRNLELAKKMELKTNRGIITNEYLETSAPDVFAAGDVAEFFHPLHRDYVLLGNWTNAETQGRVAAKNMLGRHAPYEIISNYSTSALGINIQTFGETDVSRSDSIVTRGGYEEKSYTRLLIKEGRVEGAILVNRLKDASPAAKLIKERLPYDTSLFN